MSIATQTTIALAPVVALFIGVCAHHVAAARAYRWRA